MDYINLETKEILTAHEVMQANPNISFPNSSWSDEILFDLGYANITYPETQPEYTKFEKVVDAEPTTIDGKWVRTLVATSIVPTDELGLANFITEEKLILRNKVTKIKRDNENFGIPYEGRIISTSRESQAMINSTYSALKNGLLTSVDWKIDDDTWVVLTLVEMEPIAQAVATYVQHLFTTEKNHHQAIEALATVADIEAYDVYLNW